MSLSFNNPLIIGDINAPIKKEIGNLDDLQTADKSSLVNALNDALDSTLNGANTGLSNLSDTGNARLHALKAYADEGELLTDSEGLADVKNYAHSTFDRSKFTVVGSPNITSDGVASGFTNSNYLDLPYDAQNLLNHSWKVTGAFIFKTPSAQQYNTLFNFTHNYRAYGSVCLRYASNKWQLTFTGQFGTSESHSGQIYAINFTNLVEGNKYLWALSYNHSIGQYTMVVYNVGYQQIFTDNYTPTTTDKQLLCLNALSTPTYNYIGRTRDSGQYSNVPIDLKYASVTVEGVPVFSGNKTGIDTIKPDDYTVVGTPTISADGIFFGVNGGAVETNITLNSENETVINFKTVAANNIRNNAHYAQVLTRISSEGGNFNVELSNTRTKFIIGSDTLVSLPTIQANDVLDVTLTIKDDTISMQVVINGTTTRTGTLTRSSNLGSYTLRLSRNDSTYDWKGSIDLNTFKNYIDGSLAYQPCLKIPYTEAGNGDWIVDSIYRDRVLDAFNQFGSYNAYTLSDTDFTLPLGNLYGMGRQYLKNKSISTTNRKYLYSDRTQILTGTCTSGVEVTLNTPFADDNYVLTIPYSAKSATAFTPTATGDWIALGEGVL